MSSIGFVNTQCFREAAIYWEKNKRYDDGVAGTIYNKEYWNRELDRCINGYTSGGVTVSGYYYHYLNYTRITVTERTYGEVHKDRPKNAKVSADRLERFPDFWDVDFIYFTAADICEHGISLSDYKNLPVDLNINEDSLGGSCHLVWLKPRGVGASWKAASMATRNYSCWRGSKTYMLANDKTFLTEDGLWSKFLGMRDWQISNSIGLGKRSDFKKDRNNMHMRASIEVGGVEKGYMSEVIGLSLNGDWQKARGKRGKLVLWEEFGKFPNADKAWRVARRSMEEGNKVFGLMIGFGTGGTKDANFEALKTMFYDPMAYNIMCFDNVYGENKTDHKVVGMFTPATMSIAFKDDEGNSDIVLAKDFLDSEREIAKNAKDQTSLPAIKAEDPYTPEEAVLVTGKNIFISEGLIQHAKRVEALGLYKSMGSTGIFERVKDNDSDFHILKFKVKDNLHPVYKFPHNLNPDLEGCIILYQEPYRKHGIIPKNLYKICVDTYRHEDSTGDSIGSIYVIEQPNNFTRTRGDIIVACFNGRPSSQEDFNKALYELGEYYNTINGIAFENDEPGDVIGYGKRKGKLQYLADEFELAYDENLKTSEHSTRGFGMHMASGKENKRKKQGDIYMKAWMYRPRYTKENGEIIYNYHTVYDLGLLQEWIDYSIDLNRDRVSAFRVGVYHQQELEYNEEVAMPPQQVSSVTDFFSRDLY